MSYHPGSYGAPYGAPPQQQQPSPYGAAPYGYQQPPQQQQGYGTSPPGPYGAPPGAQPPAPYGAPAQGGPPPGAYGAPTPPGPSPPGSYGAPPPPKTGLPPPLPSQAPQADAQALQMWFQSIDVDGSGELDAGEIQRALAMGNLRFNTTDVDGFVRAFDTRGRRKLNLQEFNRLHTFLTAIQASFTFFDRDRSQSLHTDEVTAALKHAGFNLDPPVVSALITRHDPDNNKAMHLDEFIRLCMFLQSCVRTFTAFDNQRTGRITLDFGQFVYAASHVT